VKFKSSQEKEIIKVKELVHLETGKGGPHSPPSSPSVGKKRLRPLELHQNSTTVDSSNHHGDSRLHTTHQPDAKKQKVAFQKNSDWGKEDKSSSSSSSNVTGNNCGSDDWGKSTENNSAVSKYLFIFNLAGRLIARINY
jgi:hypothetical protein